MRSLCLPPPLGEFLPALGDSLLIVARVASARREVNGQLIGFSEEAVHLQSTPLGRPAKVLLRYIDTVYAPHGSRIDGESLRWHILNAEIPLINPRLRVSSENDTTFIPINSILEVWSTNSHYAKWVGLGIGAILDGLIIILLSSAQFGVFWGG